MDKLKERSQLGDFCGQFGLPNSSAKSNNKDKYYKSSIIEGSHRKRRSRRRSKEECEARKSSCKSHRFTKDRSQRDLYKVKCYKCGHLSHIVSNCKLNKLKTLELDGETYEKIYGLLYTSGSDDDYESGSGSDIKLLNLSDNDNNYDNPCTTCQGNTCTCEDDEIYKLQSQFQDFNMNTITSGNVIELLKEVTYSKLREKIINLATSNESSLSSSKPFENKKNNLNDFEYSAPYSLKEVDDLKNLETEIKSLKQNQLICDHRITQIETHNSIDIFSKNKGSDDNYKFDSGSDVELLDLSDNDKNCDSPCTTCQGNTCNYDDEIYKLQSQFQDFNMNTITSNNVIELLKEVTGSKLREKIINLTTSNEASSSSSKPFENKKNDLNDFEYSAPYSLKKVDDHLLKRNVFPKKDSSFDDLKIEVENLIREIKSLKQNQLICDHRITQIEIHNSEDRFSKNKVIS
ncbi:hypothetical protein H5410_022044 [Solanum commersonii]|uniref:CCHC-type domain-containing protein n=1 Tax=Solanum commersonii TaxID=4109 RepID=A0A9J5ZCS7_SOLCO|nr:hypothetical protein H5410_022044 [Solanum commersonii]